MSAHFATGALVQSGATHPASAPLDPSAIASPGALSALLLASEPLDPPKPASLWPPESASPVPPAPDEPADPLDPLDTLEPLDPPDDELLELVPDDPPPEPLELVPPEPLLAIVLSSPPQAVSEKKPRTKVAFKE